MDISNMKIDELNVMCRTCLHSAEIFHDVYAKGLSTDSTIADNIMECAPVQISHNDSLPTIICLSCMDQLQAAHQFRNNCVQADVVLHKFLEANTKTVKIEELVKEEACDSSDAVRFYIDETGYYANEISLEDTINNIILKNNEVLQTLNATSKKKPKSVLKTSEESVCNSGDNENKLKIQTIDLNTDCTENEYGCSELPNQLTGNCNENDEGKEKRLKEKAKNESIVQNNKEEASDSSDAVRFYIDETEYGNEISLEDIINNIILKNNEILQSLNVTSKKKRKCVLKTSEESVDNENKLKIQTIDINTDYTEKEYGCSELPNQLTGNCSENDEGKEKHLKEKAKNESIVQNNKEEASDSSDAVRFYIDETEYANEISLEDAINNIILKNNEILQSLNVTSKKKRKCVLKTSEEFVDNENKLKIQTIGLNTDCTENEYGCSELPNQLTGNCNENDEGKENHLKEKAKNETIVQNNDSQKLEKYRNDPIKKRKVLDRTRFKCHLCIKTYPFQGLLNDHMRTHTGEYPFQCGVCKRMFTSKNRRARHKKLQHLINKRYMCEMCGKCFRHSNVFARHKLIHTGEKPYLCDACPKSFRNSYNFQIHKRLHTGEKPYQCDACPESFRSNFSLKTHKRVHTREKLFQGEICAKTFAQSPGLLHKRSHKKEPSYRNRPFRCSTCNKRFKSEINLNIHMLMHTMGGDKPYCCSICDKRFGNPIVLKRHLEIHSGEKPFVCEICHKCFTRESNLQEHIGLHSGEKPYECQVCGKRFAARSYLSGHKRIHMPERKVKV